MPVLEKIALDELLSGKVLPHLRSIQSNIHDAIARSERIVASLDGVWAGPSVTGDRRCGFYLFLHLRQYAIGFVLKSSIFLSLNCFLFVIYLFMSAWRLFHGVLGFLLWHCHEILHIHLCSPKLQPLVDYLLKLGDKLEKRHGYGGSESETAVKLARRLKKMLVELNEYDHARAILRTFNLKEAL